MNRQACRGAVMFGDELLYEDCSALVKKLASCTFPFQCAHGRPSIIPLTKVRGPSLPVQLHETPFCHGPAVLTDCEPPATRSATAETITICLRCSLTKEMMDEL